MKLTELLTDIGWIDESLLDEDYPTTWNADEFAKLDSFAARIRYCEQNLQKIAAGSGRVVYKIDNEKVLKLSKNKKGIAQTNTEIEWGQDFYLKNQGILADVFSYDENGLWIEMALARKLTRSKFKQIVGVEFDEFGDWLTYNYNANNGRSKWARKPDPELSEKLWDIEFSAAIMDAMNNYDMPAGDLARLSSYGLVGDDEIVLVDYGLSGDVYNTYYS